ncbi:hypothetical protein KY318_00975 [Candidatus Woesearchaeota archaeon]|nr:hypothetical protein [Candidatus Woesearchaeota archaeon]
MVLLLAAVLTPITFALDQEQPEVVLRLFWGKGCPHCAKEKEFLKHLEESDKYPGLRIIEHEVYHNESNQELFKLLADAYGKRVEGVPTTFIGDSVIVGYGDYMNTGKKIESKIEECIHQGGCKDPLERIQQGETPQTNQSSNNGGVVTLPIIGTLDTTKVSLPAFTIIIAALDSFNPCAFFVLLFLLSMLIHARSRGRMLIIGGTYVFFSGLIYFVFMAAWLNIFILAGNLKIITLLAGAIAVFIALINIKEFFFFKKGISLTIPESAKPKLFKRMREMLKASSLASMLVATVVLAVSANVYELLCTAGFPMVFTRILTLHQLSKLGYYLYLVLYNVIYVIPLFIIVLLFTLTLGAKKLTKEQGEALKLVSGLMMLGLGALLLLKPEALNNVFVAIILLGSAVLVSALLILAKRIISRKVKKNG